MCLTKETAAAIAAEMRRRNMTHRQMAEKLGLVGDSGRSYVSNVLAGRQKISFERAEAMIAILGCQVRVKLERK